VWCLDPDRRTPLYQSLEVQVTPATSTGPIATILDYLLACERTDEGHWMAISPAVQGMNDKRPVLPNLPKLIC